MVPRLAPCFASSALSGPPWRQPTIQQPGRATLIQIKLPSRSTARSLPTACTSGCKRVKAGKSHGYTAATWLYSGHMAFHKIS
eukprot:365945-Chlamydomonas_euryale.AAC.9